MIYKKDNWTFRTRLRNLLKNKPFSTQTDATLKTKKLSKKNWPDRNTLKQFQACGKRKPTKTLPTTAWNPLK